MLKINLIPRKVRIKYELIIQHLITFLLSIFITLFVLLYFNSWVTKKNASIDSEISKINSDVQDLEKIVSEVKKTEEKKSYLQNQIGVIEKLYESKTGPVKMLSDFADNVPEDLWITSLTEDNNKITLAGEALTQFIIADFLDNLKKSSYLSNVKIGSITGTKTKTFTINADASY
jgi:type IV pilus assembly protein PilN